VKWSRADRHEQGVSQADADLLRATATGDPEAFGTFFRRHEAQVTAYAVRRCQTSEEVADAVADIFLAALAACDRYRPETETALPWLYGIARRVVGSQRRARWRYRRLSAGTAVPRYAGGEEDSISEAIDAARLSPGIERALATLSSRERETLELVAHHGLSPVEVAASLGVSPNTARLRLMRARKRMRSLLDGTDGAAAPETTVWRLGVANADG